LFSNISRYRRKQDTNARNTSSSLDFSISVDGIQFAQDEFGYEMSGLGLPTAAALIEAVFGDTPVSQPQQSYHTNQMINQTALSMNLMAHTSGGKANPTLSNIILIVPGLKCD
jgi:hypothetical protein